jgi:hypothetical protein
MFPTNSSSFNDDMTAGGEDIDYLNIFGASYDFGNGFSVQGEYGNSEDYLEVLNFILAYSVPLDDHITLDLDLRYGEQEEDGKAFRASRGGAMYGAMYKGFESSYYNVNATLSFRNGTYVTAGFAEVQDGDWDVNLFDESHGVWQSSTSLLNDMVRKDEQSWIVGAGYDFANVNVPGLTLDLWYARGSDWDKDDAGAGAGTASRPYDREDERGLQLDYACQGALKGFKVRWLWEDAYLDGSGIDQHRLYITYRINVL